MDEPTFWQSAGNQIAKRLPFIERLLEPQMIRRDSMAQSEAIQRERQAETDADVEHTLKMAAASYAGRLVENGTWTPAQAREFVNFGTIVGKAALSVNPDADPNELDDDWIAFFRQRASSFSNKDMQDAFARLLAGETNNPGSFSRAAVDTLAKMEPRHAQILRCLRSRSAVHMTLRDHLLVPVNQEPYVPLVFEFNEPIYNGIGIRYNTMDELQSFGLVSIRALGLQLEGPSKQVFRLPKDILVVSPQKGDKPKIDVGRVKLSRVGQELLNLCDVESSPEFSNYVSARWRKQGCEVTVLGA